MAKRAEQIIADKVRQAEEMISKDQAEQLRLAKLNRSADKEEFDTELFLKTMYTPEEAESIKKVPQAIEQLEQDYYVYHPEIKSVQEYIDFCAVEGTY